MRCFSGIVSDFAQMNLGIESRPSSKKYLPMLWHSGQRREGRGFESLPRFQWRNVVGQFLCLGGVAKWSLRPTPEQKIEGSELDLGPME
jgi:hypothetical protein